MSKINVLPPLLADMIAAGEVVERPASVIKELIENALDAGAGKITVEISGGGSTMLRVSDDGCGMSPDDAGTCFTRHATSKLFDVEGLSAIGTMGFRGEALAAIAAVSRIELTTRERGSDTGTFVSVGGGDILDMYPVGCPEGTVITVRDIFHNTPARLKFLKTDRSEAGACIAAALRCALSRPDVSVRCIRDGREEFFTPGDGRADSAVYSLLGRDIAGSMLPVSAELEGISVSGFISSPSAGRGNRNMQFFFVNGRHIKSVLLQSALEQGYKNSLMVGKFPACALYLTVKKSSVDVNVHPAKTEVRFSDERGVFDAVYQTVRTTLEAQDKPLEIKISEGTQRVVSAPKKPGFFRTETAQSLREKQSSPDFVTLASPPQAYSDTPRPQGYIPKAAPAPKPEPKPEPAVRPKPEPITKPEPIPEPEPEPVQIRLEPEQPVYRVIGEALGTYILVELGEELMLIDKHAAHERVIFDRLKAEGREIMAQSLIMPVLIRPTPGDAELIADNAELLLSLGFELEPFGAGTVAVRSIPDYIDISEAAPAVEELVSKLRGGSTPDPNAARDELLHTVACKAAIKAGRLSDPEELRRVADAVVSGKVAYCPHGRPVSVRLTKRELDKFFGRIQG